MKLYSFEVQGLTLVKIEANSPEEARFKLIENEDLWAERLCENVIVSNSIKEEDLK